MHRDYQSNTPIRLYQYRDRLEIMNSGGLYGKARPENFPNANDYRNPVIAGALKILGYVNMFNRGIQRVKTLMNANGNPDPVFVVDQITHFSVIVPHASEASSTKSGPSRDQVGTKSISSVKNLADKIKISVNELDKLLGYCQKEHSMNEIMVYMGYNSRTKFSRKYIRPLLDAGMLALTIPDKPNSRFQKYRTRDTDI
jgi:ATP-dependent DNA helicase RecG